MTAEMVVTLQTVVWVRIGLISFHQLRHFFMLSSANYLDVAPGCSSEGGDIHIRYTGSSMR